MAQTLPSRAVHARHMSREYEDISQAPLDVPPPGQLNGVASPRSRVQSTPSHFASTTNAPADAYSPTPSPFRSNFTFGNPNGTSPTPFPSQDPSPESQPQRRRHTHSRINSRNLSIFFPRPGAPGHQPAIAEDDTPSVEAPVTVISNATPQSPPKRLGEGFKFGGNPADAAPTLNAPDGVTGPSARRGHHHKHSLSHNFFSFLDPTTAPPPLSATLPPSTPHTPWTPVTPFPATATADSFPKAISESVPAQPITSSSSLPIPSTQTADSLYGKFMSLPSDMRNALLFSIAEFGLGASMWVSGQQTGSLGCTGLGYWIVFDSFGVALGVFGRLVRLSQRSTVQQPFGSQRVETVALFAQAVYLLFASIYVCKETLEHVLLEAGSSHHHHRTDEYEQQTIGIPFPTTLIWCSLFLIAVSSILFDNHSKLVDATGNHVPSLYSLIRPARYSSKSTTPLSSIPLLANPFSLAPLVFAATLICTSSFILPSQQRPADLFLAGVETVITFLVAYPAAVALGQVLLQTAPERGLPSGQMEAFLRAMREVERHPQVLHLPAPHIWQLTPPTHSSVSFTPVRKDKGGDATLPSVVVTMELHVRKDLEDAEVLELTRWAHDRCANALGQGGEGVTVGIVRD